ncbi:acetyl-CoA carboxylase, biotin carboxylase subunit [Clostridium cavendishii DSM 21758]|uniref:biotin carboxylase n=1 Tax=Clostridium cavendishii DSM 21758 TaxID=1121302 RepID=A0A1M6MUT8_9CLOT|nr:acetyl-CoA carboxylase biotin carboxylase subunit [Clostridium cavendishii]SHJ87139.1 acetyl-CoA carboxylase, biotin carboxylase subunit [Clostridium cavendishii DSM 21758]
MFRRILIANRGEVAVRIIRTCLEMGIETVAIYSTKDKDGMHVKIADKAICIGPANASESYLNIGRIIEVAKAYEVDAIHPGYGFLAENYEFARMCLENHIKFIGPSSDVIKLMGNKINAKTYVKNLGIPIIPGAEEVVVDKDKAKILAGGIGYPVIIKATNGGGGRGIRKVYNEGEFESNFVLCGKEVKRSFNDNETYIEKYISEPRHIEVQILADEYKNILILGERDCSMQRKNQKVIEESPATILNDELRSKIYDFSKEIALKCNYVNAGTIEFLVDKYKNIYFMEMNTRLQVEHSVTELVCNMDIVKEQIKISCGKRFEYKQEDIIFRGHSMECRINAEQPKKNFSASAGIIKNLNIPGGNGIRVDSSIYTGMRISPLYDSNIAKLIVYGNNREECIRKMKRGLCEFIIDGVETNIEFLLKMLNNEQFLMDRHNTSILNDLINN